MFPLSEKFIIVFTCILHLVPSSPAFSRHYLGRRPRGPERRHPQGLQDPLRGEGLAAGHHRLAEGEPHLVDR